MTSPAARWAGLMVDDAVGSGKILAGDMRLDTCPHGVNIDSNSRQRITVEVGEQAWARRPAPPAAQSVPPSGLCQWCAQCLAAGAGAQPGAGICDRKLRGVTGLTPDGYAGFWLTATDPASPAAGDIIDYRHGTFTSHPAPAPRGYTGTADGIIAVPGTSSFWATGMLTAVRDGTSETDVLRYSP